MRSLRTWGGALVAALAVAAPNTGHAGQVSVEESFGELEARLRATSLLLAPGQVPVSAQFAGVAHDHSPHRSTLELEPGRCVTIVGIGTARVRDLDLYLFDAGNHRVAADIRAAASARLVYCPKGRVGAAARRFRIDAVVRHGQGEVMYQVFAAPLGPGAAARALEIAIDERAGTALPRMTRVAGEHADRGARGDEFQWSEQFDATYCYGIVGVGGAGVTQVQLRLFDGAGRQVRAHRPGIAVAELEYCTEKPGPHVAEIEIEEGAGEVRLGVFRR